MATHSEIMTVVTSVGQFQIELNRGAAPATAGYFRQLSADKLLDNTSIFRIVNSDNNSHNPGWPIHVIQGGLSENDQINLPSIPHEPTHLTGLRHEKWVVSAARVGLGETYGSFFITMRDEPALDYGGQRHPDGQGFAAFGKVVSGFNIVKAVFQLAETQEYLRHKITILTVRVE